MILNLVPPKSCQQDLEPTYDLNLKQYSIVQLPTKATTVQPCPEGYKLDPRGMCRERVR